MIRCQAAIADGFGRFELDTIEVGDPMDDEVLVQVRASGICHTDHASLQWRRPLIMGHEGAGIVRAIGPLVHEFSIGDLVVLNWAIPCGTCFQCGRGAQVLCESSRPAHVLERSDGHARAGGTLWRSIPIDRSFNLGTLSEWTLVRSAALTRLPTGVPFSSAAIVGCGVMTGFGTLINVARPQPGDRIVVLGCGGVGLNIIQAARLAECGRIIALDQRLACLERARNFGATHTWQISPADDSLDEVVHQVRDWTEGRGADFAFEATSVPRLAFSPLRFVRDGGMALQVSGINESVKATMPDFMWNKTYLTPLYGDCVPSRDFPRIFRHYLQGELKLDELVTRTYSLGELSNALTDMMEGRNAKGVILFD